MSKKNNKRIAKNTVALYFRMIFLMAVNLYTSRVILDSLGVDDYGIYNVVGGFVSLFALISATLSSACSRFLNFEMGKGDINRQNVVFSTAVTIQWVLAIIVFFLAEIVGVWYVNNVMVLPGERLSAANWCFQFSVFNFCMNLITVPYNASIIAHEKMKTFAYVSIFQGLAILAISFLVYWNPFDRLVFYALMLLIVQFTVRYIYQVYCRKHFEECIYRKHFDKQLLKQMLTFSMWHLVSNGAFVVKTHGVNIVLNLFWGPAINAAKGIANQVEAAVNQFSENFIMALNPQITQSYAKGNVEYTMQLTYKGARLAFYMVYLVALPIVLNAEQIIGIWLKEVPDYTVIFTQLTMISMLVRCLSRTMIKAQNATGKVRNFQLVEGLIIFFNLPVSFVVLQLGCDAYAVVIVAIIMEVAALSARIYMLPHTIPEFSRSRFFKSVILRCSLVSILPYLCALYIKNLLSDGFIFCILCVLACIFLTILFVYCLGLEIAERRMIRSKIKLIIKR